MGFESFRIELRGSNADRPRTDEAIRILPHVELDRQSVPIPGSTFYLMDDGQHVIELELKGNAPVVSLRFTLAHPPSVDSVFLDLAQKLMLELGMGATICDDVRPEDARAFHAQEFAAFSAAVLYCVAQRRAEWTQAFGDEPMAATTNEVYQRFILPRCQPGIPQPT